MTSLDAEPCSLPDCPLLVCLLPPARYFSLEKMLRVCSIRELEMLRISLFGPSRIFLFSIKVNIARKTRSEKCSPKT